MSKKNFTLTRVVRLNRYSLQTILSKKYCKELGLKKGDILTKSLSGNKIILEKVSVE